MLSMHAEQAGGRIFVGIARFESVWVSEAVKTQADEA